MGKIPGAIISTGLIDNKFQKAIDLAAQAILDRLIDLMGTDGGIVIGSTAETGLQVIDGGGGTIDVKAGIAYDKFGQRIAILSDDNASGQYIGTVDLSGNVNLSTNKNIKIDVNNAGAIQIDCSAGAANTSAVTIAEILANINGAGFGTIAFQCDAAGNVSSSGKYIKIKSPTSGASSEIEFIAPSAADATNEIFGLNEGTYPHTYTGGNGYSIPNDNTSYNVLIEYTPVESNVGNFLTGYPSGTDSKYTEINDGYNITITTASPISTSTEHEILLATVVNNGGTLTITDKRGDSILKLLNTDNISATTATEFYIGKGSQGNNNVGLKALTESADPKDLPNFRIWDINPVEQLPNVGVADVVFKWGWEKLTGSHNAADGSNTIRITGFAAGADELNVAQDALVGLKLYSPSFQSADKTYVIQSNLATSGQVGSYITVITLDSSYQNESCTENCAVITDGDHIRIVAIPFYNGQPLPEGADIVDLPDDRLTDPTWTMRLPLRYMNSQAFYRMAIQARKGINGASSWVQMPSGSYDPDHSAGGQGSINYNNPFECKLPNLDEANYPGSLTLNTTTSGFQISVSGWKHPSDIKQQYHQLEIIRTTLDNVDWNDNTNSIRIIGTDEFIDIPTSYIRKWAVGVRPLQNGQVVGTPITKTVMSGAMGVAPTDTAILNNIIVDLRTFSGSMTGNGPYTLSTIKSPSGSATDATIEAVGAYLQSSVHQNILVDAASHEFIIDPGDVHISGSTIVLESLTNLAGNAFTPSAGNFTINTTERGRRIAAIGSIQIEYNSVKGYFDADLFKGATAGSPAVLRVCQNTPAGKNKADVKTMYTDDTPYEVDTDFTINNADGALSLLFDFYDTSGSPNNTACVRGRFTLYVRPAVIVADTRNVGGSNA